MEKITLFDFEKNRTRKTKRWLSLLTFCTMFFVGQIGFAQGSTCENPIVIGSLPYSTTDNTSNYADNYDPQTATHPACTGGTNGNYYHGGNDVIYSYTPTADTSINIRMPGVVGWTGMFVYASCADIGVSYVACSTSSAAGDREINELSVTGGQTYYILLSTWPSPQTFAYTLNITENTCINSTVSYNVVSDCANGAQFFVTADITSLGSATSVTVSDNQGSADQQVFDTGLLTFGPYPNGTSVILTVANDQDANCVNTSSSQNQMACPPSNDNCLGATALGVNSGLTCDLVTAGTTLGATQSMAATPCFGNPDDDVWFSFVATADTHMISISNVVAVSGTSTDMYFQVLSGACGSTTSLLCSDPNDNTATGLTPGETYFIRVWSYATTSRQTFNICVKTMPPPPVNDDCSGAIALTVNPAMACETVTAGTTAGATQSMAATPCFGNPDDDVWFSFVATDTSHPISITNVVAVMGTSTDMYFQVLSGACDSTASVLCSDPNDNTATGLTPGETYFVRVWSYAATSRQNFNICIKTIPPPATNDDCTDAISLTVNPDLSCGSVTAGTTLGATQSMAATPCFGNPDDDVWFSFEATNTSHMVSLLNVAAVMGTSTDMYFQVLSGACDSTTSVLCSDPNSATVNGLTIGETYFVRVWSYATTSRQAFDICIGTPPPPPANDICGNAFTLTPGNNFVVSAIATTNISATNDPTDPVPTCDNFNFATNGKDIWYAVEVPASGTMTLETRGDGMGNITDTGIQVYSGTCGSLTSLGCNADDGDGNFSLLPLTGLTPGETLLVRVWGYNGTQGTFLIAAYDSSIPLCDIDAPTGDMAQTLTSGQTLADLDVTGTDLTWYSDEDLTNEIEDTTEAVDATTYYVTQTEGACTSDALAITVTVEEVVTACDLTVSISGTGWGDEITWELLDGSNAVVLSGGPYDLGFNDSQTISTINPPYSLVITREGTWCDNTLNYSVTLGGDPDISGTLAGGCGVDAFDIGECPSCPIPTALGVENTTFESADLIWEGTTSSYNVEWGITGFTLGAGILVEDLTSNTLSLSDLEAETQYQFYVSQNCSDTNQSNWAGPFNFYTGYCEVSTTFTFDYVSAFSTTNAIQNVSYTADSQPDGSYSNQSDQIIEQAQGLGFDFSTTYVGGGQMVKIWIDWNDDMVFDDSEESEEKVFSLYSTAATQTGNIMIPIDVPVGEHRVRVRSQWGTTADPAPCGEVAYGSTIDFTLSVLPAPSCLPPTALMAATTSDSATLSWTSTGTLFDIEYGVSGFEQGSGMVENGVTNSHVLDLTPGAYQFYVRQDCGEGDTSLWSGPYTFIVGAYSDGDIPTMNNTDPTVDSTDFCTPEATITVEVPSGYQIAGLQVMYSMTAQNGAWMSEQQSFIYSPTLSLGEADLATGTAGGDNAGTLSYDRMLTFANGATGNVDFVLRAWRTWTSFGQEGCNVYNNYVNNGTWVIIPTFEEIPPCEAPTNPMISISGTDVTISWDGMGDSYDIAYGMTPFTPGEEATVSGVTSPYTLSDLTTNTSYVAYIRTDCGVNQSEWVGPLYFSIVEPCNAPINVNVIDITTTSATIEWTSDGTSFDLEYGLAGFTPTGTATESGINSPYTIYDLEIATEYDFYIRRICGSAESDWVGPFSFTTLCDAEMPTGDSEQTLDEGDEVDDLDITTGDGEVTWYSDPELTQVIDDSTLVEDGVTYYVTVTNENCESEPLAITVTIGLSNGSFDLNSFKAYPNPVKDFFTISYNKNITDVTVVNMLGQVVIKKDVNSTDTQIDMTVLPTGNYIIKVGVEETIQTLKVVKQ